MINEGVVAATPFEADSFLASLSQKPGVYQMYNKNKKILYVGKAKNLKRRLTSYFKANMLSSKHISLVSNINTIEVTITDSEVQALLLEQNLIKQHKPPYNVLFKDDKSYPYIFLSMHKHPRLSFHRGSKSQKGDYFGPYPSSSAVRDSLNLLQKVFKLRQCEDVFYENRSRPCLQYQINRCLAPCCFEVTDQYLQGVKYARDFLQGNSKQVLNSLADAMENKAQQLLFEEAANIRDQIQQLQYVQSKQGFDTEHGNIDVLALHTMADSCCIHCLFIRDGRVLGSRAFFPKVNAAMDAASVLEGFISQKYIDTAHAPPNEIVISHALNKATGLEQALSELHAKKIIISTNVRTQKARWLAVCKKNAAENLNLRLTINKNNLRRLTELQKVLNLAELPKRMECFDISHHAGQQTLASCVVFSEKGPEKKLYRTFKIVDIIAGDDYAAIKQVVMRRYKRLLHEQKVLPDIVFIDGGKGQLSAAYAALDHLGMASTLLIGVAKGASRKAGFEVLHFINGQELQLDARSPALHLIQHIRDESHRFALAAHTRNKRASHHSVLEDISGIGPKRRRELLRHFGGLQQIINASQQELLQVPGINMKTAALIYAKLHNTI